MKNVYIPVNNQKIKGTLFFPKKVMEKNPAVLFIHGWGSDEDGYAPRARALTELGFLCLTISLRGHGKSDGKLEEFSRNDHLQDAIAAYDLLVNQTGVDTKNISIVGASYGGYLAALVPEKRIVNALALRAPAIYLNTEFDTPTSQLIQGRENEFFKNFIPEENNFAIQGVKKVNNLLLIESEFDQIIPRNVIELYKKENPNTVHKIIKGADHQLSKVEWKQEFIDVLVEWYSSLSS